MKRQWRLLKKDVQKDPYSFLILVLLALAVLLAGIAKVRAHDWYSSLTQPGTGFSCCNSKKHSPHGDCEPTTARYVEGKWQALHEDVWLDVPDSIILKDIESPDGKAHACVGKYTKKVICFVLPSAEI